MTAQRPIVWYTNSLYQMTDSELDTLSYYVRKRYAHYLNTDPNNTTGAVNVGDPGVTGYVHIGDATDKDRTLYSLTEPDDNVPNSGAEPDTTFGSDLTGTETVTTSYYMQNDAPSLISSTNINSHGVLFWNSDHLKIGPTSETDLLDSIVTDAISNMRTGDEVGTYRVSSGAPNTYSGTTGGWVNKGVFFTDTIYPNTTNATYNLWLKTANSSEPTSANDYARWDSSNNEIQLENVDDFSNYLIDSIFVNVLKRNCPMYKILATAVDPPHANNRGGFLDQKYASTTNTLNLSGGVYTRTFTPSGSLTNASGPWEFVISGER